MRRLRLACLNMTSLDEAMRARRSVRKFSGRPVALELVEALIEVAQGTTSSDGKRAAPSAHALYPLRFRLAAGNIEGLNSGLYDCASGDRRLVLIADEDRRDLLERAALEDQPWVGRAAGILAICADMALACSSFAEQTPYGTRGERYAYIEAGAVAQNIQLTATRLGLGSVIVAGFRDEATAEVLLLPSPVSPVAHICFGWPKDS